MADRPSVHQLVKDKLFYLDQWNIGVAEASIETLIETGSVSHVTWWSSLTNRTFVADPFFLKGRAVFERLDRFAGKGEIWTALIDGSNPQPLLVSENHLSYPCAVKIGGTWFLVVESAAAGSCRIYRLMESGVLEVVCQIDQPIVDGTLLFHAGIYWLFGTELSDANASLNLWYAERIEGPWHPHEKNPVKRDPKSARPAGNIVASRYGLIRPAQDCTDSYGRGITLCRILNIDRQTYEEETLTRVYPSRESSLTGMHTINFRNHIAIVDGKSRVFHPLAWLFKVRNCLMGLGNN